MTAQDPSKPIVPSELLTIAELLRELIREEIRAEVKSALAAYVPPKVEQISVAAYAAARSISISTVRNAIRTGRLPAMRIGTAVRVPADAELGQPVVAARQAIDVRDPATRARDLFAKRRPEARTNGASSTLRVS